LTDTFRVSLFLHLADHLPRQEENYLTQCLAAVFEGSMAFRRCFWSVLAERGAVPDDTAVRTLRVETQATRARRGRSILDLLILRNRQALVAIEAKFASGVSI